MTLETFAPAALLPKDRLVSLQARSDIAGLRRFVPQAMLYLATSAGLILAEHPVAVLAWLAANGLIQFGMFGMLHEACHRTAFASRGLSTLAGWFAALAQPMTPALMRAFHFAHHRHTHEIDKDPELGGVTLMAKWPRGLLWPVFMSPIPVMFVRSTWALFAALSPPAALWEKALPFVAPGARRRVSWEARGLVLLHAGCITTGVLFFPALLRVYAGLALGHMFLSWYIVCEHRGLATEGSVLERTRSLEVSRPLRWLLWNMPYHAEHHGWPSVPFHALPALHEEIKSHLAHRATPLGLHLRGGREA